MDRLLAAARIKALAREEGFPLFGVTRAQTPSHFATFRSWIEEGRQAGMDYLARSLRLRENPAGLLPGARSILCAAVPHERREPAAADGTQLARYARGEDYHRSLRRRLVRLAARIATEVAPDAGFRICVDSAPLLERDFAAAAGLGWIGKNGCLLNEEEGSYLLLGEILTDLDLPPDEPTAERCGSCVRCLEACPTQAFLAPGLLDAERCLSYWTIEHRGPIPDGIKEKLGARLFGCDVCQEVCPWNGPLTPSGPGEGRQATGDGTGAESLPNLRYWLTVGSGEWRRKWQGTPLERAGREGIRRNAAVIAGATGRTELLPLLESLAGSRNPGVRDAARWAVRVSSGLAIGPSAP